MEEKQISQIVTSKDHGSISMVNSQYKSLYNATLKVISKYQVETRIALHIPIENIRSE